MKLVGIFLLPIALFGQAELIPPHHAVAAISYVHLDTDQRFDFLGDKTRVIPPSGPFFQGRAKTDVIALDVAYGLMRKVELHVTVPYAFTSQPTIDNGRVVPGQEASPSSSGFSNVRIGARYNFFAKPFALTFKFDVKLPSSVPDLERQFNGTSLPVSEGQTDFDFGIQASRSIRIRERAFSVGGEFGFRYRTTQAEGALDTFTRTNLPVKPGNDLFYNLRLGYKVQRRVTALFNADGMEGRSYDVPFRFARIGNDGVIRTVGTQGNVPAGFVPDYRQQSGRRIFTVGPLASIRVTRQTFVTGGVLFALVGRNYPAGRIWVVSVSKVLR